MQTTHYLEFSPMDNPTQLSKIGNWVITFAASHTDSIRLNICSVVPRQISNQLQPDQISILQSGSASGSLWKIEKIQCFDNIQQKDCLFTATEQQGKAVLDILVKEFQKYDVEVQLLQLSES